MNETAKSVPLMYIQSSFCEGVFASNQSYFDSRYFPKKEVKQFSKEDKIRLLNKVKLIESASKNGFEVISEVVFDTGETDLGVINFNDEDVFSLDGEVVKFDSVTEINIQTIKTIV